MRVGVIGVGRMGKHHARVYRELGADLVGIADTNEQMAMEIAHQFQTKAFTNYESLLKQGLDAVSISVPTQYHNELTLAALAHGTNPLVEKPIADSVENAKKIIDAAKKAGLKLMVGHIERFNPVVLKLKEIIAEGILGNLIALSARRVGPFVERVKDVGIVLDIATHDIDIARYLVGTEPVEAFGKLRGIKHGMGDCAFIIMEFEKVTASIEVNWFTPHKVRTLVVTGTKGIAYADYMEQNIIIYNADWKMEPKVEKQEPLKLELQHFLDCIATGKEPLVTGEEGLKTLKIALEIENAYQS